MHSAMLAIFIAGYALIVLEQKTRLNKTAVAILLAVVCWSLLFICFRHHDQSILQALDAHLAEVSAVIFYLQST